MPWLSYPKQMTAKHESDADFEDDKVQKKGVPNEDRRDPKLAAEQNSAYKKVKALNKPTVPRKKKARKANDG